jgi:hypothetical protein
MQFSYPGPTGRTTVWFRGGNRYLCRKPPTSSTEDRFRPRGRGVPPGRAAGTTEAGSGPGTENTIESEVASGGVFITGNWGWARAAGAISTSARASDARASRISWHYPTPFPDARKGRAQDGAAKAGQTRCPRLVRPCVAHESGSRWRRRSDGHSASRECPQASQTSPLPRRAVLQRSFLPTRRRTRRFREGDPRKQRKEAEGKRPSHPRSFPPGRNAPSPRGVKRFPPTDRGPASEREPCSRSPRAGSAPGRLRGSRA